MIFFEMFGARVQDLLDAKKFRAQQVASILDTAVYVVKAAVYVVKAAIHVAAEIA